jgi:glycosyltransferase involved in cell wall biosynthesis
MQVLSLTNCPLDPKLGSGKTVLRYSEGLRTLGHSVDVFEPKNYQVWQGIRKAEKIRHSWGAMSLVCRMLQVKQYDLIECYGDVFWLAIQTVSKQKQRPLIVAHTNGLELLHRERSYVYSAQKSSFFNEFTENIKTHFSRMAFTKADAFVSLCELDRQYVLNQCFYSPERTAVVEPGLDEEYLSIPFSTYRQERVAFVGSWTPRKGIDNLCKVITKVLTQNPELQLDLYGTNVLQDSVLSCFPVKLHDRIAIYPNLSNQEIADGLSKAKIFFFPTQYEGYGMALAEAMACGCAAVTTPTGFGAELQHEKEALVCDFGDTESMEHAISRLLHDRELWLRIARKGWERVRSLTWEENIQKLETVYKEWIAEHQRS